MEPPVTEKIRVAGIQFDLDEVQGGKLYHGSPTRFPVGTILEPGHGCRHKQSAENAVSITSDAARARYWGGKDAFVYEVEPLSPVDPWRVGLADGGASFVLWEGRVLRAKILRAVTGTRE